MSVCLSVCCSVTSNLCLYISYFSYFGLTVKSAYPSTSHTSTSNCCKHPVEEIICVFSDGQRTTSCCHTRHTTAELQLYVSSLGTQKDNQHRLHLINGNYVDLITERNCLIVMTFSYLISFYYAENRVPFAGTWD